MRKFQIGVMGSASDLKYSSAIEQIAEEIGQLIAEQDGVVIFGAEKDGDSLSTAACRGAKRAGGLTVGVTYGKGKDIWQKDADIIIPSGLERGGGRETVLVLSCDAIIAISGGSGTLTEMAIAYQADIPRIAIEGVGGWSAKLAGTYIDNRKRRLAIQADSAKNAVRIAFDEAAKYRQKYA
jgi:uncharacterized protein (TIGR00725 family)